MFFDFLKKENLTRQRQRAWRIATQSLLIGRNRSISRQKNPTFFETEKYPWVVSKIVENAISYNVVVMFDVGDKNGLRDWSTSIGGGGPEQRGGGSWGFEPCARGGSCNFQLCWEIWWRTPCRLQLRLNNVGVFNCLLRDLYATYLVPCSSKGK